MNNSNSVLAEWEELLREERRSSLVLRRLQVAAALIFVPIALYYIWSGSVQRPLWLTTMVATVVWMVPFVALDNYVLKRRISRIAGLLHDIAERLDRVEAGLR